MKSEEEDEEQLNVNDDTYITSGLDDDTDENTRLNQDAEEGANFERQLTVKDAIRAYPTAIFWCLVISTCVIMEGYDTILIGNFFAYHTFQRKYGVFVGVSPTTQSGYQLTAGWQAALGNASGLGAFFGTLLNGYLVQLYGHRIVLLGALFLLAAFVCMTFWAPSLIVLCIGEALCGLPWGVFATAAPAYASEVLPMSLRVYFTSWTNMCFIIGQFVAAGVLRVLSARDDEWGFRIPFAIQWLWPTFLIPLIYFAPASPYHEVQHGRYEPARKALKRLVRSSANVDINQTLAAIIHTDNFEKQHSAGTSYWDCFKGFERRRTEIACFCFAGQILSGILFAYNSSYFFEQLGLQESTTYSLNLGGTGLAFLGTICNWFLLMPYFGRRTIFIWGMFTLATTLYTIGILNVWTSTYAVSMFQAVLTLSWTLVFQLTIGQLGWALPAEMGSTRLRQKTICLARNAYYVASVLGGVLQPFFMNPTALNLRGYTGFIWGTTAFLMFAWAFFRLPESRNRTYEELDILFANEVPARKFATTNVLSLNDRQSSAEDKQQQQQQQQQQGQQQQTLDQTSKVLHDADRGVEDDDDDDDLDLDDLDMHGRYGHRESIELVHRRGVNGDVDAEDVPLVSSREHDEGYDEFGDFAGPAS